jgi:hypothetical protein
MRQSLNVLNATLAAAGGEHEKNSEDILNPYQKVTFL